MNLTAGLRRHAQSTPDAPAIITPRLTLDFAQLDGAVSRAAGRFGEQGLQPGDVVTVDIADPVWHMIAALALARIGVAHLARLQGSSAASIAPLVARLGITRTISDGDRPDDGERCAARIGEAGGLPLSDHGARPWLYVGSSATTGHAKLVAITQAMVIDRWVRFAGGIPVSAADRFTSLSDLAFQATKVRAAGAIDAGGAAVLASALDFAGWMEFISRAGVNRIKCAPVHLHALCAEATKAGREPLMPQLSALEVGGSVVTEALRRRASRSICRNLYVSYNATEIGVVAVAAPGMDAGDSVGRVLDGVELEIVDDSGAPLPATDVGMIRIRASGMVHDYVDDAALTARAFRQGWFYPGDLGVLSPDRRLSFKGRADDMMIFDGINIYPAEIEVALADHAAVKEAAAFPLKSEAHADVPVAAVTVGAAVSEANLLDFCRARLGVRAPVRVFVLPEMPRNPAGKILKRALPGLVQARRQEAA